MRKVILSLLAATLSLSAAAQGRPFIRYSCTDQLSPADRPTATGIHRLPAINTQWDATRTYNVPVVLISFADNDFSMEEPTDRYNRIFNEEGYNEGKGKGCVADYFRDQSAGLLNMHFDIYGPVKLTKSSKDFDKYGNEAFSEAIKKFAAMPDIDFKKYDWRGNNRVPAVICIFAGMGGNESVDEAQGHIWPNTGTPSTVTAGGVIFSMYSASAEMWSNNKLCGIGTICHEFSHALGLPDLYPTSTSSKEFSVVDEWDLMDGGNFINTGWCPPSYSVHEKMLLGWFTPTELTSPTSITNMKPVADGGTAYILRTNASDNEFFLLENRQWKGWDLRTPGHGLLISHVDYNLTAWSGNKVNNDANHHLYDLVHADNLSYADWDNIIGDGSSHTSGHSLYLSGTTYPYVSEGTVVNNAFTDESTPAATTYSGSRLLSKPVTDIIEAEDGTLSFHFMGGTPSAIVDINENGNENRMYDLQGRAIVRGNRMHKGIVITAGRKLVVK